MKIPFLFDPDVAGVYVPYFNQVIDFVYQEKPHFYKEMRKPHFL